MQIFIHRNNQQLGPFTEAEVKAQLAAGTISLQDHVWWQGQSGWMPLGQSSLVNSSTSPVPASIPATPPLPGVPAPTNSPTSNLALWSLICGVCSLLCGLLTAIPAIILGHMGLSEIKKNPALKGHGMALSGLIIGYIVVVLFVVSLTAIIILEALGAQVKDSFKQIDQQLKAAQSSPSPDSSTNSDQPAALTNSPDQATNSSDSMTNSPDPNTNNADLSTNSTDTNSPDTSTNSTSAPDSK